MDYKEIDYSAQALHWLYKSSTAIWLIVLGLVGKFSHDLVRGKKMSWPYVLGSAGLAVFCGSIAYDFISVNYPNRVSILVPAITMVSNNLISAVMAIDYNALLKKDWKGAFDILFRK